MVEMVVVPEEGKDVRNKDEKGSGVGEDEEERERKGLGGLSVGLLDSGRSNSSMKPPSQLGHARSKSGEGVRVTMRLHWWQK